MGIDVEKYQKEERLVNIIWANVFSFIVFIAALIRRRGSYPAALLRLNFVAPKHPGMKPRIKSIPCRTTYPVRSASPA
jgi:hypothetical protein